MRHVKLQVIYVSSRPTGSRDAGKPVGPEPEAPPDRRQVARSPTEEETTMPPTKDPRKRLEDALFIEDKFIVSNLTSEQAADIANTVSRDLERAERERDAFADTPAWELNRPDPNHHKSPNQEILSNKVCDIIELRKYNMPNNPWRAEDAEARKQEVGRNARDRLEAALPPTHQTMVADLTPSEATKLQAAVIDQFRETSQGHRTHNTEEVGRRLVADLTTDRMKALGLPIPTNPAATWSTALRHPAGSTVVQSRTADVASLGSGGDRPAAARSTPTRPPTDRSPSPVPRGRSR
ncbi:hypothetical protein ABT336_04595 [Micromonospora sp. NPDC000207]|uniref:hypothetical protein n=1 Tax=Micromonospora sp. NPDC000207 TaxID=3154246 RepID=UPI00332C3543